MLGVTVAPTIKFQLGRLYRRQSHVNQSPISMCGVRQPACRKGSMVVDGARRGAGRECSAPATWVGALCGRALGGPLPLARIHTHARRTNTRSRRANKHNNQLAILYSVTGQSNRLGRLLQESRRVTRGRAGCRASSAPSAPPAQEDANYPLYDAPS